MNLPDLSSLLLGTPEERPYATLSGIWLQHLAWYLMMLRSSNRCFSVNEPLQPRHTPGHVPGRNQSLCFT